jgi:digeranylgeranylglycerophospholipid reductase
MALRDLYDIVIIGAGPAGLRAGMAICEQNDKLSLLLVDKTIPWDKPAACAEGVGRLGFEKALDPDPAWIRQVISTACFHSPDGTSVAYTDQNKGYIIDRALMQRDLAKRLKENFGIDSAFNNKVQHIAPPEFGKRKVCFENGSYISAQLIIDASGPVSCFGKNENIAWKPYDLEPAYFALVKNVSFSPEAVHLYVGQRIAPGGYAWLFPRSNDMANIGVVVGNKFRKGANLQELLASFLKNHFPSAKVIRYFAGPIPCGYHRSIIAVPGFIKAGDAASTINPISRAGIAEALLSGALAGSYALKMLGATTERKMKSLCQNYEKEWFKERGSRHQKLAKAKNELALIPDEDYNRAAHALAQIPQEELTMSKIFRTSLSRFPRLVWTMRHLM